MPLPKDGEYYATHTLIGSSEINEETGEVRTFDSNRRHICRWPSSTHIEVWNAEFEEWTPERQAALDKRLAELNGEPKP